MLKYPKSHCPEIVIEIKTVYVYRANIRKALGARDAFETLHLLLKKTDSVLPMLRFTPLGKEAFALMLNGLKMKAICERMGMSVSGVRRHREKMLLQNDCNSMTELLLSLCSHPSVFEVTAFSAGKERRTCFYGKKCILLVRITLIPMLTGEFYGTCENNHTRTDHHPP
jgi:DNA-binding CsgD family transcriptional regulator